MDHPNSPCKKVQYGRLKGFISRTTKWKETPLRVGAVFRACDDRSSRSIWRGFAYYCREFGSSDGLPDSVTLTTLTSANSIKAGVEVGDSVAWHSPKMSSTAVFYCFLAQGNLVVYMTEEVWSLTTVCQDLADWLRHQFRSHSL